MAIEPLALEHNLALMAGAGAGKTHSLMTLCLHLLAGARAQRPPLKPAQLCLLTFTDKAAGELRLRLRDRVEALAHGAVLAEVEPELHASLARLGRMPPPPSFWRKTADELGAASVGTFHGLCVQLLRRAPAGVSVEPSFELLDETAARWLIEDLAERLVLSALEREEPSVVELCRELQFRGQGRFTGLVDLLCQVYGKAREEGLDPELIPITDETAARDDFQRGLKDFRQALSAAIAADAGAERKFSHVLSVCQKASDGLSFENFLEEGRYPAVASALAAEKNLNKQRKEPLASALKDVSRLGKGGKDAVGLRDLYAAARVAPHERAFRSLLARMRQAHREELRRRAALDFSELLIQTRDLLRDHPSAREEVQRRVGALLVDEFQDTNRLQLELVLLLAEKREGAPRALGPRQDITQLPLEPAVLCAVGDRKQSIYEFRGADVSVFGALADKIEGEGGLRSFLQRNWRSSPALVSFFNGLFGQVMAPTADARTYEVAYAPAGDDLVAQRPGEPGAVCVERLVAMPGEDAASCREQDAEAVARRIAQLLGPGAPALVRQKDGALRVPRPGDVAILFRRFVHLETYRQALTRHRIPHRVVRGRGFYGAQEVLDLAAWLSLLADPGDGISLASVLRSPLVGVQDATLLALAEHGKSRLSLGSTRRVLAAASLPPDESDKVQQFLALFDGLEAQKDRLSVREVLKVALAETDYRVLLAGTPFAEQALANVDKLCELAGRWETSGRGDCASFAKLLLEMAAREPNEAQADVLDIQDGRAVQLLTIHAAKGLEFPVVFVPDLAAQPQQSNSRIPFDRTLGLCIKPWLPDHPEALRSMRSVEICGELQRRERAEYKRLLYVALTRAKDYLVLSGQAAKKSTTWRSMLDSALELQPALRARVRDVPVETMPTVALSPTAQAPRTEDAARLQAALDRVGKSPSLHPTAVVFPVTHLQDFFLCPRRYLYARQVQLSEYPIAFELEAGEFSAEGPRSSGRGVADSRQRGTLAHKLLETLDFKLALESPKIQLKALRELLWAQGTSPDDSGAAELLEWVQRFLGTPFARRLAELPPSRVHREMPFLLRLKGAGTSPAFHLKGTIDLLLEEDDKSLVVVDYKATRRHPMGVEAYAFQLDCYALAASHLASPGATVRTGISFLQEKNPKPELREVASAQTLRALDEGLQAGQAQLLLSSQSETWPGREPGECARIHCGYQYRCHAATPGL